MSGPAYVVRPDAGKVLPQLGTLKTASGALEIIEYHGPIQPPPHVHREHDEAFYILEGVFTFTLDGDVAEAGRGALVVVPRGTVHGFTTTPTGKALLVTVPGGLAGFFTDLAEGIAAGTSSQAIRASLAGKYDSFPA